MKPGRGGRRKFLETLAGAGIAAAMMGRSKAAEFDPRVAKILAETIAVDIHSHAQIAYTGTGEPNLDLAGAMKRAGFSDDRPEDRWRTVFRAP